MAFIRPIIKGGGTDVSDTTAVASDVLVDKDFYLANGTKATGTIPTYSGDTEITENGTLETEGKYLASDIVVNVSGGASGGYVRPTGSFNGDTLAQNAVSIESGGVVYDPLYVLVAMDTFKTVSVQKNAIGRATGGDAFVFSDEPETLYIGNTTHDFDPAFDSATSENWKSRYIIVYSARSNKENANGRTVNLYNYRATYEMVGCSGTIFSKTSAIFGNVTITNSNFKYCNLENATFYNNTISAPDFCRNCAGLLEIILPNNITTISSDYCLAYTQISNINLPNLTTISGRSFIRSTLVQELYLPQLTTLTATAYEFMQNIYTIKTINLPLLTDINSQAFKYNYNLKYLLLPSLINLNGSETGFNCYTLYYFEIPSTIQTITNTINGFFPHTRYIGLPTDFDIDAVNLTGATGYNKSIAWFHHLATQLKDNSGGTAKTMVLGAENIPLIPSADATTISNKNWTLS